MIIVEVNQKPSFVTFFECIGSLDDFVPSSMATEGSMSMAHNDQFVARSAREHYLDENAPSLPSNVDHLLRLVFRPSKRVNNSTKHLPAWGDTPVLGTSSQLWLRDPSCK